MKKEAKCPWCGETVAPEAEVIKRSTTEVVERKCPKCGKILAAYMKDEPDFMPRIRKF